MIRMGFLMKVGAGKHAEYKRRHDELWPEMDALLKEHGVHSYTIWLDAPRNLLFAHVEVESKERWDAIAATPVCRRWWAYMKDIMETNPDASPVAEELAEVFHLEGGGRAGERSSDHP